MPDLHDFLGLSAAEVAERLGTAATDRVVGVDRWLVYDLPAGRLRVRLHAESAVVASWTLTFNDGFTSLRDATEPLGLWPLAGPDQSAPDIERPLLRRALPGSHGRTNSLTVTVRDQRFISVSCFDEQPDWM